MPPAPSVNQTLSRAARAAKTGQSETAQALYQSVLDRFPGNTRARAALVALGKNAVHDVMHKALTTQRDGNLDKAEHLWRQAVALSPDAPEPGISLSLCCLDMGRTGAAMDAIETVLAAHPDHPVALDTRGRALRDMGRHEEARDCHMAALGHGVADAGPLNHLGILAQARGDRHAAQEFYSRAIDLRPDNADLHHNLSRAKSYSRTDRHLKHMRDLLRKSAPDDPDIAPLHFALFNALADIGPTDVAFDHLETGNRLRKSATGYDVRRDAVRFAHYKALFAKPVAPPALDKPAPVRPVFIVGLPRSGTTLAERILARTDGCQTCGELSVVPNAVAKALRNLRDRAGTQLLQTDVAALRHDILTGLLDHSDGSPVMIDKMPLNFRWVGFICAALPEARIVHMKRDPVDVAWSIYRHLFAGRGNGFAYDPADISTYMLIYRDLMQFWQTRFPDRVFDVSYEDVTTQTKVTTQAMARACGLNWSDACLHPEQAAAQVLTASSAQVRRPIHAGGGGQWRRYETQLVSLLTALQTAGII